MAGFYKELNFRKTKWSPCCSFNPSRSNIVFHLDHLNEDLSFMEANNSAMSVFKYTYKLKSLIKEQTCYKNPNKPPCIDLMLRNKSRSFKHSCVIQIGLSNFYMMKVTVLKAASQKHRPKVVYYRDQKYFENSRFRADSLSELSKANIEENEEGLSNFLNTCKKILDLDSPLKKK